MLEGPRVNVEHDNLILIEDRTRALCLPLQKVSCASDLSIEHEELTRIYGTVSAISNPENKSSRRKELLDGKNHWSCMHIFYSGPIDDDDDDDETNTTKEKMTAGFMPCMNRPICGAFFRCSSRQTCIAIADKQPIAVS